MPGIFPHPKAFFALKMPKPPRSQVGQYGTAVLSVIIALLLRMALSPVLQSRAPFIMMFPAVVVAAWSGGWRPGLLAVALSTLISWFLFSPPAFSFRLTELTDQLTIGIFVLNGIGISAIAESQHRGRRRMLAANEALRTSEQYVKLAIAASNITLYSQDAALRYTWLYNTEPAYPAESLVGRRDQDLMPAEDAAKLTALKQQVMLEGRGTRREVPLTIAGETKVFDLVIEPTRDGQGNITGIIGTSANITERTRTQAEQQFLSEASFLLASSLDYNTTLQRVAKLAVPYFADWCVVDMLNETGALHAWWRRMWRPPKSRRAGKCIRAMRHPPTPPLARTMLRGQESRKWWPTYRISFCAKPRGMRNIIVFSKTWG